jgi:thiol:disulfide interchange protein DsbC
MKHLAGIAVLLASLLLAIPAWAQQDPVAEKIKAELKKKIPEAPVDSVRKVPYGNLYEVVVGSELFYTDDKASFILLGSIVDMKTRENVSELRMRQLNRVVFDTLPLDQAIKIVRGNG